MKKGSDLVPPAPMVEADFSKGVRGKYARHDPDRSKTRITIYIDDDILEYFRERARRPGAAPYQTQINDALRHLMEQGLFEGYAHLVENEQFIRAVAERVAALQR
jgi:uncharacterized protein (DUF4415 family)